MHFAGLPLSTLLAIFGGVGATAVVLYLLKLRRRAVPVPFARIWDRVLRDKESSELFSQLKRWLSLLLQLVLLAALVLAIGDPRFGEEAAARGRNVVVLIDASLSMQAIDVKPTRLAQAKLEARRFVRGLGSNDRAMIVQMDMLPAPLSTLSSEPSELEAAIDQVKAEDTPADLPRALAFAEDTLRGLSQPEIVLVTDGALDASLATSRLPVEILPVGSSDTNLAITEFSARRYPLDKSRVEVMLEVTNTTDRPQEIELSLLGDGVLIDVTRLLIGPNERLPRFYTDISGASRRLEARIKLGAGKSDDLPADDRAYALMPERRRARVLVVTRGNTYLEAALLLDEYLDVTYVEPSAYPPKERFDVTILDGVAPSLVPSTGAGLFLNPPADKSPIKLDKPITDFGFDRWNKKSPLLRFLALGDVQIARGYRIAPEKSDEVLAESDLGPILVSGMRGGQRVVVMSFDPRDSDFVLRPAWPLFVLGAIDAFIDEDTSYLSSFRTGGPWRIPAASSAETAELITPRGDKVIVPVKEGRAAYFGNKAGFYKLRSLGTEVTEHEFAANVADPFESHIKPDPKLKIAGKPLKVAVAGAPGVRHRFWAYLLLFVAAASLIEWATYHRRVTV